MGSCELNGEARYIHGEKGKGMFTFYGGHDPEDYQHQVGDPATVLDLHPNSPGYRFANGLCGYRYPLLDGGTIAYARGTGAFGQSV